MFKSIEELGDSLCGYCEATERGIHACVGTPDGPIMCEGRWCDDAYDTYLEECEEEEDEMEQESNEIRYYLRGLLHAMEPMPAGVNELPDDETTEVTELQPMPFVPTYLITAVMLPTGAIELAVNTQNIKEKIEDILSAYDDDMRLINNKEIVMQNIMIV